MARGRWKWIGCALAVLVWLARGGGEAQTAGEGESAAQEALEQAAPEPVADAGSGQEDEAIDPESLRDSGSVLIKQYQAAWIGSGTLGKGTLTYQGRSHPRMERPSVSARFGFRWSVHTTRARSGTS